MAIRFDDQVALVTGAGQGLGRAHALALAARGAKVVVNDFGGAVDGSGGSATAAETVVAEIEAAGGTAMADGADVSDLYQVEDMVAKVLDKWGRIDVLINNAGILRDKSFTKMEIGDFRKVVDVHLMGSVNCSLAVWPTMREQNYGRIIMTTSASGLYGNFGQSNYSAAKMAVAGLMNTLELEGGKYNVRVNTVAPVALTRMTEEIVPEAVHALLQPDLVTPGVLFMAGEDAPSGEIIAAGAGSFARAIMLETEGMYLGGDDLSPEKVADNWAAISDLATAREMKSATDQTQKFIQQAMDAGAGEE